MQKKSSFRDVTSIRQKIMLPFLFMLTTLVVALIWLATHFLNGIYMDQAVHDIEILTEQFVNDFTHRATYFDETLDQLSHTEIDQISGYIKALEVRKGFKFNWKKSERPFFIKENFKLDNFSSRKGGYLKKLVLEEREARLAKLHWAGVSSVLGKPRKRGSRRRHALHAYKQATTFPEMTTDETVIGVFYQQSVEGSTQFEIVSTPLHLSPEFLENSEMLDVVVDMLSIQSPTVEQSVDEVVRYRTGSYRMIASAHPQYPSVVTVMLISMSEVYASTFRLVGIAIFFLLLIGGGIFFVYSVIIRRITTSLEILASVAKKVSLGDLDQHIFSSSKDEIGSLSKTFNMMISNLKTSSEKLLHEKKQSEAIMASIPEGILVTDLEHNVVVVNEAAEELLGFSFRSAVGKSIEDVIDNAELRLALVKKLKKKSGPKFQEVHLNSGKNPQIFAVSSSPVRGERSKLRGQVTVIRDITHDKELEELRESFLRIVSHELRTPLTSIIGFIDLVKGQKVTDDQKKYLQIAYDEAISLKELINNLLELSRIEAGDKDLTLGPVKVTKFVNQITSSLEPIVKGSGLELINHISDDSLQIAADSLKLKGIFINLISNAIKFTDSGSVELDVVDKDDLLEFSVKDTGIGLNEDEKEVIFEKFRQVDYSSTRQYEGIGLGLSLVKQLIELHDGKIWVESEYEKGSTFYFTISKSIKLNKKDKKS